MRKVQPASLSVQVLRRAVPRVGYLLRNRTKHQLKPVITAIGETFTRNGIAIFPRLIIVGGDVCLSFAT